MFTSFSTALSALSALSSGVDVVGNNLANLNTTGFKSSAVVFHDLVSQSLGAEFGQTQIGFGVGRPSTIRQFSQGAIQPSNGPLDAAIQGDGFLVVKDSTGMALYTRAGNLQVDKAGFLITVTGEKVQGWTAQGNTLNTSTPLSDILVPVGSLKPAVATRNFSFDMNLSATASIGPPADQFSSSIEVVDSLGASHVVTAVMTKSATPNQWNYSITVPNADVATAIAPVTGTFTFDSSGKLITPAQGGTMPAVNIAGLKTGAADMPLTWNLYNGLTNRLTQFAQPSATSANSQDGSPAVQLVKVGLADGGNILAQYSNGQQIIVGQLGMAAVRNPESLIAVGNNNFQLSARSASPAIGTPGTGGRGTIMGGAVESSTVDIAKEFTNLIILQRGYQANAKVITTVDELSQDTINLKR